MAHDPRFGPDLAALHPLPRHPRVVFIRNLDLPSNVEVGAYTYYDDPDGPDAFLRNVLYQFACVGELYAASSVQARLTRAALGRYLGSPHRLLKTAR